MTTRQETPARTVDAPYTTVEVRLDDDLYLGYKIIRLDTDLHSYPSKRASLDPAAARELARYLLELADLAEDDDDA